MEMNREYLNQLIINETDINDLMTFTITIFCHVENKASV